MPNFKMRMRKKYEPSIGTKISKKNVEGKLSDHKSDLVKHL